MQDQDQYRFIGPLRIPNYLHCGATTMHQFNRLQPLKNNAGQITELVEVCELCGAWRKVVQDQPLIQIARG